MVAKSTKAKSKRRPAVKTKAKRGSKPLLARSAEVRKTRPPSIQPVAVARPVPLVAEPPAIFSVMGRVVQAYAELPSRLAQCRTPVDVWNAQTAFTRRILGA
jgi:hypothetical protein